MIWDRQSDEAQREYERNELSKIHLSSKKYIKYEYHELLDALGEGSMTDLSSIEEKFKRFADAIGSSIESALYSDEKLLIMAQDIDNVGAAAVIHYLITKRQMSFASAVDFVKERRISLALIAP